VPNWARLGPALFYGLSYRVEAGVEQPGWASCPFGKSKPPKSARTKEAISFEITGFTKRCSFRCNGESKRLLPLAASAKVFADVQLDAF